MIRPVVKPLERTLPARTIRCGSSTLKPAVEALNSELVGAVKETVQPAHVSVWLRPDTASKGEQAE